MTLGIAIQTPDMAEFVPLARVLDGTTREHCPYCGTALANAPIVDDTLRPYVACAECAKHWTLTQCAADGQTETPCCNCGQALAFTAVGVECGGNGEGACEQRATGCLRVVEVGTRRIVATLKGNVWTLAPDFHGAFPRMPVTSDETHGVLANAASRGRVEVFRGLEIIAVYWSDTL